MQEESHTQVAGKWLPIIDENANPAVLLCCGVASQPAPAPANGDEDGDGYGTEVVLEWCMENQYEHIGIAEWRHAARGMQCAAICTVYGFCFSLDLHLC